MSGSETNTVSTSIPRPRPATVEALLDREEAMAIQRLTDSVQRLGSDLSAAADLRGRIRRQPLLAAGLGAFLGFVGSPFVLRAFERGVTTLRGFPRPNSPSLPGLSSLAMTALRSLRRRA